MNITIINGNTQISSEDKIAIESRLRIALSRFSTRIARITVRLSLIGELGIEVKSCRIEVALKPRRILVAEEASSDLQIAVDSAADQIARSIERKLHRERKLDSG